MSDCVCTHSEDLHGPSKLGARFNKIKHTRCGICGCKKFRDREIWKYHCGYHERWERQPCAND